MTSEQRKFDVHLIGAARPNFMKIAPLYHALKDDPQIRPLFVHTGQHYDKNMAGDIMEQLGLPRPDFSLGVGSGSHAEQTGRTMIEYEKVCLKHRPDLVVVVGDVNATAACSMVAAKLGIKLAHLEAGLRSFDRTMPEEINRIVTDALADILWIPSEDARENLLREGVPEHKIELVGNIMIDALLMLKPAFETLSVDSTLKIKGEPFALVTIHRPSNVDNPGTLLNLISVLKEVASQIKLVFPLHPRTKKQLESLGALKSLEEVQNIILVDPLPYLEFMNLLSKCKLVITDSGGLQEETTYLKIPCLTLRPNTERPITISMGTNRLCKVETLANEVKAALIASRNTEVPPFWDGGTAGRLHLSIRKFLNLQ